MLTVGDLNTDIRSTLSDEDSAVYTDSILLPFIKKAYRWAQTTLVNRGCSLLRDTATLSPAVPIGTTLLNFVSSPALPADLIVPYQMWERPSGGLATEWIEMQKKLELPVLAQTDILGYWVFESGAIDLLGATVAREVKIEYERELPALTGNSSNILILGAEDAIANYAASRVARSRTQPELGNDLRKEAEMLLSEVANRYTHGEQHVHGVRRTRYSRR